jgi:glutathione S-transferase
MHPLSSYCHKALIAFYENNIPFEPLLVDATSIDDFKKLWPLGKFPVLKDENRDQLIAESTSIIEYLALHYPGKMKLVPEDPTVAHQVRLRDRFFDNYLHAPMQKFPANQLRPVDKQDLFGLEEAKALYRTALGMVEVEMANKEWAMGDDFTMADCAAAPALFFGDRFYGPFRQTHPQALAYLDRLMARSSYARALAEATPYMRLLPR